VLSDCCAYHHALAAWGQTIPARMRLTRAAFLPSSEEQPQTYGDIVFFTDALAGTTLRPGH